MMPRMRFDFSGTAPAYDFGFPNVDFTGQTDWRQGLDSGYQNSNQPDFTQMTAPIPQKSPMRQEDPHSAFDKFMQLQDQMPIYGDKQYERGKWGKLGSVLAGAATGAVTGDAKAGMEVGNAILNRPFEQAYSQWQQRFKPAKEAAVEERQRGQLARQNRLTDAQTANLESETRNRDALTPLNVEDIKSRILERGATIGLTDVKTKQALYDFQNPDVVIKDNNKGGVNVFSKTGQILRTYEGLSVSEPELVKLRGNVESRHINERGAVDEKLLGKRLDFSKLQQDRDFSHDREMENTRFGHNVRLEAGKQEGRANLQDDAQQFKAEHPTQATGNLTNPQFNREFKIAMNTLGMEDPKNAEKIQEVFDFDKNGNVIPAPGVDESEYLRVYNLITSTVRKRGSK